MYKSFPFTGIKDSFEPESIELYPLLLWRKGTRGRNFHLEHSIRYNRTTFSDFSLLKEIFHWDDPKSRVLFTFQPNFPKAFCTWYTTGKTELVALLGLPVCKQKKSHHILFLPFKMVQKIVLYYLHHASFRHGNYLALFVLRRMTCSNQWNGGSDQS